MKLKNSIELLYSNCCESGDINATKKKLWAGPRAPCSAPMHPPVDKTVFSSSEQDSGSKLNGWLALIMLTIFDVMLG